MPWFWSGAAAGRRRAQRHDVPLGARGAAPAHAARHAAAHRSTPVRITGHIASLKWTRPRVREAAQEDDGGVDYRRRPSRGLRQRARWSSRRPTASVVIGEATTSWSFVGPGLRLSAELLGPEYSMRWNSLDSGLDLFFSRDVKGRAGEDLVEKQNAEVGLMPVVADEAVAYGYEAEDRHFVRAFLGKEAPRAHLARRARRGAAADGRVPERGAGEDAAVPAARARQVRAGGGAGGVEAVTRASPPPRTRRWRPSVARPAVAIASRPGRC